MKIGVVGLGYWGPNLVRNFLANERVTNVVVCDTDPARVARTRRRFRGIDSAQDFDELLRRDDVPAVAIITPPSTHYNLALKALNAGKHVLIEKPLALTLNHAKDLLRVAQENNQRLMVDQTFLYTGAVRKIREIINSGEIGDLLYFDSVRVNLGLFQHDTNVVWDLAAHDVSIMSYLVDYTPTNVSATGLSHYSTYQNMAYVAVNFKEKFMAHFHVNWLSPVKIRRILIGGSKKMIVYDDGEPDQKVKIFDKGIELSSPEVIHKALVQYRTGDMYAPKIETTEALILVTEEFLACVIDNQTPSVSINIPLNVVRILEKAESSLAAGGVPIELEKIETNPNGIVRTNLG